MGHMFQPCHLHHTAATPGTRVPGMSPAARAGPPDAVGNFARQWDISAIADPQVVEMIAAQTAEESLATWGTLDPNPPPASRVRLDRLSEPTIYPGRLRASLQRISTASLARGRRPAISIGPTRPRISTKSSSSPGKASIVSYRP